MTDAMSDKLASEEEHVLAIANLLSDAQSQETVALDVRESCGFADFFVIATVNSQGHLRGLITQLDDLFRERAIEPVHPRKRDAEMGWVLIDLGFVVVHLMSRELREFYELERLWFGSRELFPGS